MSLCNGHARFFETSASLEASPQMSFDRNNPVAENEAENAVQRAQYLQSLCDDEVIL